MNLKRIVNVLKDHPNLYFKIYRNSETLDDDGTYTIIISTMDDKTSTSISGIMVENIESTIDVLLDTATMLID